uniref:Putative e3 ubiquitin ligase n=1 Tax=Ornithodoros turicata TaxID=34597 RepID=A0A2R5LB01_9ACAR
MKCYWGLAGPAFHSCTDVPWLHLNEGVTDGSFWQDCAVLQGNITRSDPSQAQLFHLKPPRALRSIELGQPPRQRIPLVIVLMKDHVSCDWLDTDVVALFSSIHITDDVVTMKTSILEQYLKVASGRTCLLQQLYVSVDETTQSSDQCGALCVVCQVAPVTCALLPCRHACVCDSCFNALDICPMCRTRIVTFFNVSSALHGNHPNPSAEAVEHDRTQRRPAGGQE